MTTELSTDEIVAVFNKPLQWLDNYSVTKVPEFRGAIKVEHFLEYLEGPDRIHFFNWLSTALVPGMKVHVVVPFWSHLQAISDWQLRWPPMAESSFYFLEKKWREQPGHEYSLELGYTSDFDVYSFEYDVVDDFLNKHDQARVFGIQHYLGVVTKLYVTLIRNKPILNE